MQNWRKKSDAETMEGQFIRTSLSLFSACLLSCQTQSNTAKPNHKCFLLTGRFKFPSLGVSSLREKLHRAGVEELLSPGNLKAKNSAQRAAGVQSTPREETRDFSPVVPVLWVPRCPSWPSPVQHSSLLKLLSRKHRPARAFLLRAPLRRALCKCLHRSADE